MHSFRSVSPSASSALPGAWSHRLAALQALHPALPLAFRGPPRPVPPAWPWPPRGPPASSRAASEAAQRAPLHAEEQQAHSQLLLGVAAPPPPTKAALTVSFQCTARSGPRGHEPKVRGQSPHVLLRWLEESCSPLCCEFLLLLGDVSHTRLPATTVTGQFNTQEKHIFTLLDFFFYLCPCLVVAARSVAGQTADRQQEEVHGPRSTLPCLFSPSTKHRLCWLCHALLPLLLLPLLLLPLSAAAPLCCRRSGTWSPVPAVKPVSLCFYLKS